VGIIVAARGSSEPVTYFLLRGSLLIVSTISRVVVIHLIQPQAAGTNVNFFFFFFFKLQTP
jgi:hypothetical protein